MKRADKFLKIFLYVGLVITGFVAGIVIRHFHNITVSEEVNILDMATLVITVFLAVYIPAVLDRRLQTNKEKQELLMGRLNDYQTLVRRVNMIVQSNSRMTVTEYLIAKNLLDVSEHKLETFISLMKSAKMSDNFDKELREIKRLSKEHKELLLSEEMEEKESTYPDEVILKEEKIYAELDKEVSVLIFRINDAK